MNYIEFSKSLLSLTEEQAIVTLKENRVQYCIRTRDGVDAFYLNGELRPQRILLEIEKGIVVKTMVS